MHGLNCRGKSTMSASSRLRPASRIFSRTSKQVLSREHHRESAFRASARGEQVVFLSAAIITGASPWHWISLSESAGGAGGQPES